MHNPKVSVLIPAYNYGRYLGEAIQSALDQTFGDFELIVFDNQSTDNSVEIVNEFIKKDNRVRLVVNKTNVGMFRNYNEALLHAKGEYIKFLNADDKLHPEILEKFVKVLDENPSVSLVTSFRQEFHDGAKIISTDFHGLQNAKEMILLALSKLNFIGEPTTVMFRKENLNIGLFDTSLLFFADLDMWLRHLGVGDLYIVDEVLSYVRKHSMQGTQELKGHSDKSVFIAFQWPEYVRNSILMNRFGYNFYQEDSKTLKKIFKKSDKAAHRLLFTDTNNNKRVRDYFSSVKPLLYLRYFIKTLFKRN
ncbi:glycosyltransferase family 2 protein [bacterium]|nr:glycosyltransferase family 2 protein [bacterium]MBU1882836.1 glycosyltransferase family 2 protein [bacterium]